MGREDLMLEYKRQEQDDSEILFLKVADVSQSYSLFDLQLSSILL